MGTAAIGANARSWYAAGLAALIWTVAWDGAECGVREGGLVLGGAGDALPSVVYSDGNRCGACGTERAWGKRAGSWPEGLVCAFVGSALLGEVRDARFVPRGDETVDDAVKRMTNNSSAETEIDCALGGSGNGDNAVILNR